jgi:transposase
MSTLLDTLPESTGLRLDEVVLTSHTAVALIASASPTADCPRCGTTSDRVHSHYHRTVADLPWHDWPSALRLLVRRFRCTNPGCPQAIFCERLPELIAPHARTTARLTGAHQAIGFALGGEAGARLAEDLDMPTSPDTLLRRVKDAPDEPTPPPRYVGIDDWALRKGQRYGTILIDLERGRVIDILPGRDGEALKAWLKGHPQVEVITRDRWAAYAEAAAAGAPQAQQVADRWHLLKNLREAVERLLGRLEAAVHEALREPGPEAAVAPPGDAQPAIAGPPVTSPSSMSPAPEPSPTTEGATAPASLTAAATASPTLSTTEPLAATAPATHAPSSSQPTPSPRRRARQARQRRRAERHQRVRELRAQGQSLRQIARATGLSVKSVINYLRQQRCPDWNPGRPRPTQLDALAPFIDSWIEAGGRNAAALHRKLVGRNCVASYDAVRRYLARRLGSTGRPGPRGSAVKPPAPPPPPSARKLSFEFIRRPTERTAKEQGHLDRLRAGDAALREGLDLAAEFAAQVRKAGTMTWAAWLAAVANSGCAELRSFAEGLRQDEAAIVAALTGPWSNGPVEGQVNRLKVIKRQMYGRAGWRLLRARVRNAG